MYLRLDINTHGVLIEIRVIMFIMTVKDPNLVYLVLSCLFVLERVHVVEFRGQDS